jgi:DNA-binding response OmpR family regulator
MHKQEKEQPNSIASFGPYRLDVDTGQLWRGKQEVKVTPKAFMALCYFVDHPGQLVTKDESAYSPRSGWLAGLGRLKDG